MAITYNLGAAPLWTDWMQGILLAGGTIEFFKSSDHSIHKAVYKDSAGAVPWANPLTLDAYGRSTSPIYFQYDSSSNDTNYFLIVKNSSGTTDYTIDNYNGALTAIPATSFANQNVNFVRNPQFSVWEHQPLQLASTGGNSVVTTNARANVWEQVCDDWYIMKSNANATDTVSRQAFSAGQTLVPFSPSFFLRYNCTTNTGGETLKRIGQIYRQTSEFLNGQVVSLSFYAQSASGSSVSVYFQQFFGTTGSPSSTVDTLIQTFNLTSSWQQFTWPNFTIPATTGKVQGTDEFSSYCVLYFAITPNIPNCTYDFCDVQLEPGAVASSFKVMSYEQYKALTANEFKVPTGAMQVLLMSTLPAWYSGWLAADDGTIGNPLSVATHIGLDLYNLFCFIYANFADAQCPVTPGPRTTAIADWNLNKKINLPLTMARLMGNYGAGAGLTARVAGVTGGAEDVLKTHSHTFNTNQHVATANIAFTGVQRSQNGADDYFVGNTANFTFGDITATDNATANYTNNTMNPFSFLQWYIHK